MSKRFLVKIGIKELPEFVRTAQSFRGSILAIQGQYTTSAKTILALFAIDLAYEFILTCELNEEVEEFNKKFEKWKFEVK